MSQLDSMTAGEREKQLVAKLRAGVASVTDYTLPFFVKIQIQTQSYCNADCVTCPYGVTSAEGPMGRMEESLFHEIVAQLRDRGVERASLFLMNEPLLDRRLAAFTAHLKAETPSTRATIITNGTLFDGDCAQALADAGMDEVSVSVNGFTAESYGATMVGLSFERIQRNLEAVAERVRCGSLGDMEVRVVALEMGDARAQSAEFAERIGLPVYLKPLTNRAGSVDAEALCDSRNLSDTRSACQRPFVKAYVLFDGTMVLCNCDWKRRVVLGNVRLHSLQELWHGPVLAEIRRQHAEGDVPAQSLCGTCDYPDLI